MPFSHRRPTQVAASGLERPCHLGPVLICIVLNAWLVAVSVAFHRASPRLSDPYLRSIDKARPPSYPAMDSDTNNFARTDDGDTHLAAAQDPISMLSYLAKLALVKREAATNTRVGLILGGIVALTLLVVCVGYCCVHRRDRSLYIQRTGLTGVQRQRRPGGQRRWADSMQPPAPAYEGYRLPRYSTR